MSEAVKVCKNSVYLYLFYDLSAAHTTVSIIHHNHTISTHKFHFYTFIFTYHTSPHAFYRWSSDVDLQIPKKREKIVAPSSKSTLPLVAS